MEQEGMIACDGEKPPSVFGDVHFFEPGLEFGRGSQSSAWRR